MTEAPVRIVSDGKQTKVFLQDGTEVKGITKLRFDPIDGPWPASVEITIWMAELDVMAHPLLSLATVRQAAHAHGYSLAWEGGPEVAK